MGYDRILGKSIHSTFNMLLILQLEAVLTKNYKAIELIVGGYPCTKLHADPLLMLL